MHPQNLMYSNDQQTSLLASDAREANKGKKHCSGFKASTVL